MRCRGDRPGAWPGACQLPCRPRAAAWRLQVHRTEPPERGVSAYVVFPPPLLLGCRGHPAPVSRQPCPTGRALGAQAWLEAPGILTVRMAPPCGFSSSSRHWSGSCPLPAQPGPALFPVSVLSPEPTPPSAAVASLCVRDTVLLSPPVRGARRTSAGFGLFVPRMRFGEMIWQHDPASRTRNLRPAPLPSTAHWFPSCWAAVPRAGLGGAPRAPPASAPPRTPVQRMEG